MRQPSKIAPTFTIRGNTYLYEATNYVDKIQRVSTK